MIPKIIHLCWLSGDPFPPIIEICINSWKKKLPEYKIIVWDKKRFDINSCQWVKQSFENKKYAFAADYIRFYALYNYGGIYLDADVEVLKSFNPLLVREYILGEEAGGDIEAAVVGAEKGAAWVKECLDYYDGRTFIKPSGNFDMRPVPLLVNSVVRKYQMKVFPYQYFSPKDYNVGRIDIREETYTIHHFDGKWVKKGFWSSLKKFLHKTIYILLSRKGHNFVVHKIRIFVGHK